MTHSTTHEKDSVLQHVLNGLMEVYSERVPDVKAITAALIAEGVINTPDEIENDHIAFRTIGVPQLGIQSLEQLFLHYGYTKKDHYRFPEKKLDAYWYAPPSPQYPRIFISELIVCELSPKAQHIIHTYTNQVPTDPVLDLNWDDAAIVHQFLHSALWSLPTIEDYRTLAAESEYAAWVIYNRYYLNHYTLSVQYFKEGYNTLPMFNAFLEKHGFVLNDSGGKMKISQDGLLLQSATVAAKIEAVFKNKETMKIASSYVEFAERRLLPQFAHLSKEQANRSHYRDGFEINNANTIFESTYTSQTNKI